MAKGKQGNFPPSSTQGLARLKEAQQGLEKTTIKNNNTTTMKQYFIKSTSEEVKFGDTIELDLTKDLPNGNVHHHHLECKFVPALVPLLLEKGIIEEKASDKDKSASNSKENNFSKEILNKTIGNINSTIQNMLSAYEKLELKVEQMEKEIHALNILVGPLLSSCSHNCKCRNNIKKQRGK